MRLDRRRCAAISLPTACSRLLDLHDVDGWWPARTRFEVMVGAVLVQNTQWANVVAAIRALRRERCLSVSAISTLKPADLANLIRPAGCQRVKAKRLQAMTRWIEASGGLRSLAALDTDRLRAGLLGVNGIGRETADAILCFGFGRPRFVADRYARRWISRMGLAAADEVASYDACSKFVERGLRRSKINRGDLHAAIVLHAQSFCGSRPACEACALRSSCGWCRCTGS